MNVLRYAKGAALVGIAAAACAFAGTPVKDPAKEPVKEPAKTSAKKCPYTTQECLNYMAARLKASGWIGIEYDPENGNEISRVVAGSPAEKAGLQPGDRLFALNGVEIKQENQEALTKARKEWAPGQTVHYTVTRGGAARQVDIVLAPWPADILARYIGEHMLQHAEDDAAALNSKR
jgi:predicted metalloprotease with PDZ domain